MQCEPPRRRDIDCNPLLSAYGMYSTVCSAIRNRCDSANPLVDSDERVNKNPVK
jgi:hypothetical protein